jgi:hypothetical protein
MSSLSNSIDNMIADNIRIRAALAALRAELAAAQTENARLQAALEQVETVNGECPWCKRGVWYCRHSDGTMHKVMTHAPDCQRESALRGS